MLAGTHVESPIPSIKHATRLDAPPTVLPCEGTSHVIVPVARSAHSTSALRSTSLRMHGQVEVADRAGAGSARDALGDTTDLHSPALRLAADRRRGSMTGTLILK
jgi:hypothetical protein